MGIAVRYFPSTHCEQRTDEYCRLVPAYVRGVRTTGSKEIDSLMLKDRQNVTWQTLIEQVNRFIDSFKAGMISVGGLTAARVNL